MRECAWQSRSRRAAAAVTPRPPHLVTLWGTSWIARGTLASLVVRAPSLAVVFDYGLLDHLAAEPMRVRGGWRRPYDAAAARTLRRLGADGPLQLPRRFVFCSEAIRRIYEARLGPLPGAVVPHGVHVPDARPPLGPRNSVLHIGAVGRLVPEKGFDVLLAALAELARSGAAADLEVEIRGPAPEPAHHATLLALAASARGAGAAIEVGPPLPGPEAVALWMGTKDCIVNPAVWEEPFALVPLEVMAAGRPLVSTPTGGSAELLEDGVNALVVPPGDATALAAALRRIADDSALAERIAAGGFDRVRRQHRIEDRGPELDRLLLEVAARAT